MSKYFWNILVSLDQLANTILGGDPDETISSRIAKRKCLLCKLFCFVLDLVHSDHCAKSIEADEGKDAVDK